MGNQESKSVDLLGLKPFGDAANTVAKGLVDGAGAFLGRICLPAAEEFGWLLRDKVHSWRGANAVKILNGAETLLAKTANAESKKAPARIVYEVMEKGSWCHEGTLQAMWSGLLASSCTENGGDESNLMYIDLLHRLTTPQARLLSYVCEHSRKHIGKDGALSAHTFGLSHPEIGAIMGITDSDQLDCEVGYLQALGLLVGGGGVRVGMILHYGTPNEKRIPQTTPTSLALHFYAKCQGSRLPPRDFFKALPAPSITPTFK